jgi:hypothetical protein
MRITIHATVENAGVSTSPQVVQIGEITRDAYAAARQRAHIRRARGIDTFGQGSRQHGSRQRMLAACLDRSSGGQ